MWFWLAVGLSGWFVVSVFAALAIGRILGRIRGMAERYESEAWAHYRMTRECDAPMPVATAGGPISYDRRSKTTH